MRYHFRAGRGKNIIVDGAATFAELGFAILKEYQIIPDHLFMFQFSNGDTTDSACPLGPIDDGLGNVSIEMKIKDRKMDVGEIMTFVYDYSRDWSRKVKLIEKLR